MFDQFEKTLETYSVRIKRILDHGVDYKKVFIHGASFSGYWVFQLFATYRPDIEVVCFIDEKKDKSFCSHIRPILTPQEFQKAHTGDQPYLYVLAMHPVHCSTVTQDLDLPGKGTVLTIYHSENHPEIQQPVRKATPPKQPIIDQTYKIIVSSRPRSGTNFVRSVMDAVFPKDRYDYVEAPSPLSSDGQYDHFFSNMKPGQWAIGHIEYSALKKHLDDDSFRWIYLYRDPRDYIISILHHLRYSNLPIDRDVKHTFTELSDGDAISMIISGYRYWTGERLIKGESIERSSKEIISWMDCQKAFMLTYEDATKTENTKIFLTLFDFVGIHIDRHDLDDILYSNRFENLAHGRKQGVESKTSHYRKGIVGDWKNYFTPGHKAMFKAVSGESLIRLGYEKDMLW